MALHFWRLDNFSGAQNTRCWEMYQQGYISSQRELNELVYNAQWFVLITFLSKCEQSSSKDL